jgi:hypothetical protein
LKITPHSRASPFIVNLQIVVAIASPNPLPSQPKSAKATVLSPSLRLHGSEPSEGSVLKKRNLFVTPFQLARAFSATTSQLDVPQIKVPFTVPRRRFIVTVAFDHEYLSVTNAHANDATPAQKQLITLRIRSL